MPGMMADAGETGMVEVGEITVLGVPTHSGSSTIQVNFKTPFMIVLL